MSVSKPDKRRKYDDAFKAEVLRLARESRSTRAAARQLGISEKLLYRWQQAQSVTEPGSVEQAQDPAYRALQAENQHLERELAVLKKSLGHLRPRDPVSPYRFIERQRGPYPVRELCQVLDVAPSAYYAWRQRRQRPAPAWERAVCRAFARYGTRRLRAELQAAGYQVGCYRIRHVLRQYGLRAQQPRSFVPRTTDSGHGQRVAQNRLLGRPRPTRPD